MKIPSLSSFPENFLFPFAHPPSSFICKCFVDEQEVTNAFTCINNIGKENTYNIVPSFSKSNILHPKVIPKDKRDVEKLWQR